MNKNIIIWLVMLDQSIKIAFSVKSVKLCMYSCNVSLGLCFLCKSLEVCTFVAIGEYTPSNYLSISGQFALLPILFSIL